MRAAGKREAKIRTVKFMLGSADGAGLTALLVFLSVTNHFAFHIFLPSLPGLAETFDASPTMAQLTVSLYVAAFAVAQLVYGPLSDRYGRRRVILAGLAIYTVAPLLCANATSIEALAAGRALQAVGGCAGMMFARVVARDLHARDRAAGVIGLVTMLTALATAVIPMLGGYLDVWLGWQAGFWCAAGLGVVVFAATWTWLPETRPVVPFKSTVRTLVEGVGLLRSPVFLGYAGHATCTLSAWYAMLAGLPYVMAEVLREPPTAYGHYFPLLAAGFMLGNLVTARVAHRWGIGRLIVVGAGIAIAGCVPLLAWSAFATPVPLVLFLPMAVVVFGHGLGQPAAQSGAIGVRADVAGSAAGMMGFGQWLTAAAVSQLVGIAQDGTVWPTIVFVTFFTVLSAATYMLARWGEAREHSSPTATRTESST